MPRWAPVACGDKITPMTNTEPDEQPDQPEPDDEPDEPTDKQDPAREAQNVRTTGTTTPGGGPSTTRDTTQTPP